MDTAISILDLVFSALNIGVVLFLGLVVGRVPISLYRGINELAGYIQRAVPPSDATFNIFIENRGYAEKSFSTVVTDKGDFLFGWFRKVPPQSVTMIPLDKNYLPTLRKAREIYVVGGLRRKKKEKGRKQVDRWQRVKIIKERELRELLDEYDQKTRG